MTTDLALAAIKAWIELRVAAAYPALSGVPILLRDTSTEKPGDDDEADADDFDATFILLNDVSAEAHPVLHGVLIMEIEAMLCSVPNEDLGATDAVHRAMGSALYHILADRDSIAFCDNQSGFTCWDIRGVSPTSDTGDGVRATTFSFSMTGAAA